MRLLHTKTLQFEEFFDSNIPRYAILSHRWEGKEISFQEFRESKKKSGVGFSKTRDFCSLAKRDGYKWVWIDTCCIDKKSSAELSEAINSMYRWYGRASACYAYLSDVLWEDGNRSRSLVNFRQSVWFTRGWTLQELLAPSTVGFFDSKWKFIGAKKDMLDDISAATGVKAEYLQWPNTASVATKMSWASKRKTSRMEDVAYCLMGIFDVNMPLLYGEGSKAFLRLQLEIIKQSDDESIFAWTSWDQRSGLLATSPSSFAESGDIYRRNSLNRLPYSMTNKGLQFHAPRSILKPENVKVLQFRGPRWMLKQEKIKGVIKLPLLCSKFFNRSIAITLGRVGDTWCRADYTRLYQVDDDGKGEPGTEVIYIQQTG